MDLHICLQSQFDLIFILTFMNFNFPSLGSLFTLVFYLGLVLSLIHSFIILEGRISIRNEKVNFPYSGSKSTLIGGEIQNRELVGKWREITGVSICHLPGT